MGGGLVEPNQGVPPRRNPDTHPRREKEADVSEEKLIDALTLPEDHGRVTTSPPTDAMLRNQEQATEDKEHLPNII